MTLSVAVGQLTMAPATTGPSQRFNAYGDATTGFTLQGPNGAYVAYSGSGYRADQPRSASLAQLALQSAGRAESFLVTETVAGASFYWKASGTSLMRIDDRGQATVFSRTVVTPGVDGLTHAMNADLTYADLTGASLEEAVLGGSDLSHAILTEATLTGAALQGCTVNGTAFTSLDLAGVLLTGVKGTSPDFTHATFDGDTDFSGANIPQALFIDAAGAGGVTLNGIHAEEADFTGAKLPDAVINNAELAGSRWVQASLSGAQVSRTHFDNAVMSLANLTNATLDEAVFDGAQLVGADFAGATITNASARKANLTNARLADVAGLKGIDLSGALLAGAQLSGKDLRTIEVDSETVFMSAQLDRTKLAGLKLDLANFARANMAGCNLSGASLRGTILVGANLKEAKITGNVVMVGADLSNASLEGADLTGAQLGAVTGLGRIDPGATKVLQRGELPAEMAGVTGMRLTEGVTHEVVEVDPDREWEVSIGDRRFLVTRQGSEAAVAEIDDSSMAAVLANTFMPNAVLTDANLFAVDLSGASFYGPEAKADGANLRQANLSNAQLATMKLAGAKLAGANLSFACLVRANLRGADLGPAGAKAASLAFASLQGADLTGSKLAGANLSNAAVALDLSVGESALAGVPLFELNPSLAPGTGKTVSDALRSAFAKSGYPLIDTATVVVDRPGQAWRIDNQYKRGEALQSGYGIFVLRMTPLGPSKQLNIFGSSPLLVIRQDVGNVLTQDSVEFSATLAIDQAMDATTTCPSGMRLGMRDRGMSYDTLMTPGLPPTPPGCIPSTEEWCDEWC